MTKPQVSTCDRPTFKALTRELYDFAQEVRVAIRTAVDVCVAADIQNEDDSIVRMWAVTLGPLMHDVSGSALLLLSHGDRRAPVILARSLFEYQLRQRYYALKPEKAKTALNQLGERFKKVMRADFTWKTERTAEQIAEIEAWLAETQKIERENIKEALFKTVYGDDAPAYYDGLYGKWSALTHGYETIFRDVHRDGIVGEKNPQPDFRGKVWVPNDTCATIIHSLLDGLGAVVAVAGDKKGHEALERRWDALQKRGIAA